MIELVCFFDYWAHPFCLCLAMIV